MSEHSKFSPSKAARWADCPGRVHRVNLKFHTHSHEHMLKQSIEAERLMKDAHDKLIAEGYQWDGMDGYTKDVKL